MTTNVAVVGASGYTGSELIRLLAGHPHLELAHLSAKRSAGRAVADVFPYLGASALGARLISEADADAIAGAASLAFLALPHKESAELAAELLSRGLKVVDLSADFRLRDAGQYEAFYGPHPAVSLLSEAVYGLPERYREAIAGARLVASPGCYPTAAILAAAPLLAAGLVEAEAIAVDAKSGVSGAGRSPTAATHFPEAGEGIRAYAVGGVHRHTPEIEQELSAAAGIPARVLFTPHLVPISRGIFSCAYLRARPGTTEAGCRKALAAAYEGEPFVHVLEEGAVPDTSHVRGSNHAQVAVRVHGATGLVLAMSAIDNLVKGASGQAIQSANLMLGLDETAGLLAPPLFP